MEQKHPNLPTKIERNTHKTICTTNHFFMGACKISGIIMKQYTPSSTYFNKINMTLVNRQHTTITDHIVVTRVHLIVRY